MLFYKIIPELQDQDRSVQDQDKDQDRIFWSQTGLVLRPTVSDHITAFYQIFVLSNFPCFTNPEKKYYKN